MGFFAFLGRHLGAAIIAAIGVILLAVGYAQAADAIATGFPPWALQATGAAFFVIAVVRVLYRYEQEHAAATRTQPALASVPTHQQPPVAKSPTTKALEPVKPPPSSGDRLFVSAALTPEKFMAMCEGKTSVQGQRIVAPYIGKWMRSGGVVRDFNRYSETGVVSLEAGGGFKTRRLYFKKELDRLELLEPGDTIVVDGRIKEIDTFAFHLEDCEIVSINS